MKTIFPIPGLLVPIVLVLLAFTGCKERSPLDTTFVPTGPELVLADGGTTNFRIVLPAEASAIDHYAAEGLAGYLAQATTAEFPVIEADAYDPESGPAIFLGVSPAVIKAFDSDPVERLAPQEFVALTRNGNLFLFGEGMHGNLHAASDFLQNSLGWRWYSVFEPPVIPEQHSLALDPFVRKGGFDFAHRFQPSYFKNDFFYWLGMNMYWDVAEMRMRMHALRENQPQMGSIPFQSELDQTPFVHTSLLYIPPSLEHAEKRIAFDWLKNKNYFETNPEFFSLLAGKRTPRQLDFANPELRAELTRNIIEHIERVRRDGTYVARGRGLNPGDVPGGGEEEFIIAVDAEDAGGQFSQSPEAKALMEAYQSPGGPLFDYLIELGELLEKEYPGVMLKTLAYRRSQTQIPPVLPEGKQFPDNLIVVFAPVEDCFLGDWSHPDLQETVGHYKDWRKLVKHLWTWIYPNPYGSGGAMPFANVRGLTDDLKKMKELGGDGIFLEQGPIHLALAAGGFTELQTYLFFKVTQDTNADVDALIVEFTDAQYGAAAPLVRKYLEELEGARRSLEKLPEGISYHATNYDERTFPYLTAENVHRWQQYFDRGLQAEGLGGRQKVNLERLRRELDFATLYLWFELAEKYPDTYRDHTVFSERIREVNNARAAEGYIQARPAHGPLEDFEVQIEAGGKRAPLPPQFEMIEAHRIQQFVPRRDTRGGTGEFVRDPEAAFGYAGPVDKPDLPLQVGFYQWTDRNAPAGTPRGKHGSRISIPIEDITPGTYKLYKLGPITVTADSLIWFSAQSWATRLEVGDRLYVPDEDNEWTAWVSLKFDGPTYGGKAEEDQVLCDRIILVPKNGE